MSLRFAHRVGSAIAIGLLAAVVVFLVPQALAGPGITDAEAYWRSSSSGDLYGLAPGSGGAFLYSPVVAQIIAPLTALPLATFVAVILVLNLAAMVYLVGPIGSVLALALPFVRLELIEGNIHILLAAALVAALRGWPGWWCAFPLTKVSPAVLLLWEVGRWRRLAVGLGVAALLVLVSFAVDPGLWDQWIRRLLMSDVSAIPSDKVWTFVSLQWRILLAIAIVLAARWRDRPAALPFALLLAMPIPWVNSLAVLLAVPSLLSTPAGVARTSVRPGVRRTFVAGDGSSVNDACRAG